MSDVQTARTKKKKPTTETRKAEIKPDGYLKLCGRGRPSGDKKYCDVSGEKLELLRRKQPVKA
jgi:hypothetical protein